MISTTTTTINSTVFKNTFKHTKETKGLMFSSPWILAFDIVDKFHKSEPGLLDLVSDQPKVLIPMTTSFYHLYHDHIGEFLTQYELTPDAKFIIDITSIKDLDPLPEYIKMFFKFLNSKNIDYRPVDFSKTRIININNFYYKDPQSESFALNHPCEKLYKFAQEYVIDKNIPATKKVYLSRKNFKNRDLSILLNGELPYENDNRIDDEEKLEEYFRSIGFEIIVPEDFETFEDQINLFYEAKTIVSATSSGLINACFMRPGSIMVEISTPLISFNNIGNGFTSPKSTAQEEIHHFYHRVSMEMNHNYISIPNMTRESQAIIDKIESNNSLKNMLVS